MEEDKIEQPLFQDGIQEDTNIGNLENKEINQERQGLEDEIRANHQNEPIISPVELTAENLLENSPLRKNEQFSSTENEVSKPENTKPIVSYQRKSNSRSYVNSNTPFGYTMPNRSETYSSFVESSDPSLLTTSYMQMRRNTVNAGSRGHTESISSFPVTNYEDSEFMIQAYQRKKKAYEK